MTLNGLLRVFQLSPFQLFLLIKSLQCMIVTQQQIKRLPFDEFITQHRLHLKQHPPSREYSRLSRQNQKALELKIVRDLSRFSQAIGRYFPSLSNCLVQALSTQRVCARYGIITSCSIGVGDPPPITSGQDLQAHAWLSHNNSVFIGNAVNLSDFLTITEIK